MSGEYVRYRCVLLGRSPISQTWHCVYQPLTGHTYPRKGWGSSRKKVRVCAMRWGILLGFIWKEQGRFFSVLRSWTKRMAYVFFSVPQRNEVFFSLFKGTGYLVFLQRNGVYFSVLNINMVSFTVFLPNNREYFSVFLQRNQIRVQIPKTHTQAYPGSQVPPHPTRISTQI